MKDPDSMCFYKSIWAYYVRYGNWLVRYAKSVHSKYWEAWLGVLNACLIMTIVVLWGYKTSKQIDT